MSSEPINTDQLRALMDGPGFLSSAVENALRDAADELDALRVRETQLVEALRGILTAEYVHVQCIDCQRDPISGDLLARRCDSCGNTRIQPARLWHDDPVVEAARSALLAGVEQGAQK